MKTLKVQGKTGDCEIILGAPLSMAENYFSAEKTVVITDSNVKYFHGHLFSKFPLIEIGTGEQIKTLSTVEQIYEKFLDFELDRKSFVLGIGGGIVCDLTGFAASTFMRGLPFGFVPSTLLSQVDASIGGKNGFNFKGYKNLIGVFRQPEFCLCDMELLKTLPERELRCGFAEIIKHGAIESLELFSFLEEHLQSSLSLEADVIEKLIYSSLLIKSAIVTADETEKGERRKLNFGHTIGHAIEHVTGLPHGEAISIGMCKACELSVAKGMLEISEAQRLEHLLENTGLPTKLDGSSDLIFAALKRDKKRQNQSIWMCLLEGIGRSRIVEVKIEELEAFLLKNEK